VLVHQNLYQNFQKGDAVQPVDMSFPTATPSNQLERAPRQDREETYIGLMEYNLDVISNLVH